MKLLLLESIIQNKQHYFPYSSYSIDQDIVLDSRYDTSEMLKLFISKKNLQAVTTLVEKNFVPVNAEDGSRNFWCYETALAFALYKIKYASSQ